MFDSELEQCLELTEKWLNLDIAKIKKTILLNGEHELWWVKVSYNSILPNSLLDTFKSLEKLISKKAKRSIAKRAQSKNANTKAQDQPEKLYWDLNQNENQVLERPFVGLSQTDFLFYVRPWENDVSELDGALAFIGREGGQSGSMNKTGFAFENRKMNGDQLFEGRRVAISDISQSVGGGQWIDIVGRGKTIFAAKNINGKHELIYIARNSTPKNNKSQNFSLDIDSHSNNQNFTSYSIKKYDTVQKLHVLENFLIVQKNKTQIEAIEIADVLSFSNSLEHSNKTSNGFRNRDEKPKERTKKIYTHEFSIENGIRKITSGREHCVVLSETQKLYGFGANRFNQLSPSNPEDSEHSLITNNKETQKIRKLENLRYQFQQLESFDYEVIENVFCGGYLTLIQTRKGSIQLMGRLNKQTLFKYAREIKIENGNFDNNKTGINHFLRFI